MAEDTITISRSELKDLQLQIRELQKEHNRAMQRLDRTLARLLGEIKPRPLVTELESRTGRESKCALVRRKIQPIT